jgi:uncharacterized membrane protein YfcA
MLFIGLGAGFVQRVSGFGLGIFSMIFFPHFLPAQAGSAISCMHSSITSTYNSIRYRKHVHYRLAVPMLCAALLTIPLAVRVARNIPTDAFRMLLGGVLVAFSLYFLIFQKRIRMKPNLRNGIFAGTLGGVLNGLFATGGPPVVLYLSSAMKDKAAYFATIQFYFAFTNIYATTVRAVNGLLNGQILLYTALGIVGCFLGDGIGRIVFDKLDSDKVKSIIYLGMILSGILMLV